MSAPAITVSPNMTLLEIRNVTRRFGDFVAVDDPVNIFHFCTMVEARNDKQFLSGVMAPVCATS
jgi:hypothetical protein